MDVMELVERSGKEGFKGEGGDVSKIGGRERDIIDFVN